MPLLPLERDDQKRSGTKLMLRRSLVAPANGFAKVSDGAADRFAAFEPGCGVRKLGPDQPPPRDLDEE